MTFSIFYDTEQAPITFDAAHYFCVATVNAEIKRATDIEYIIINNKWRKQTTRDNFYTEEKKAWRLRNIIARLPVLINPNAQVSILTKTDKFFRNGECFPPGYAPGRPAEFPIRWSDLAVIKSAGLDPQIFKSNNYALRIIDRLFLGRTTIVLSIRNADFNKDRDTNLSVAKDVYSHFSAVGFNVVVIPDQDDALGDRQYEKYEWQVFPQLAMDIQLRLAAYERAYFNVAWGGGHSSLLWLSKAAFRMFGAFSEGVYVADKKFWTSNGLVMGENPVFFSKNQYFDWLDGKYLSAEYIIGEIEEDIVALKSRG